MFVFQMWKQGITLGLKGTFLWSFEKKGFCFEGRVCCFIQKHRALRLCRSPLQRSSSKRKLFEKECAPGQTCGTHGRLGKMQNSHTGRKVCTCVLWECWRYVSVGIGGVCCALCGCWLEFGLHLINLLLSKLYPHNHTQTTQTAHNFNTHTHMMNNILSSSSTEQKCPLLIQ